jgi:hypothetical protein
LQPILNKLWPLSIFWSILIILIWNMWLLNVIVTKLKSMFILNIVLNNILKFNMSKPTWWFFSIYATSNLSGLIYHDWTLHYKPFFICFILLLFSFCVLCFYFSCLILTKELQSNFVLTLHNNFLLMNIFLNVSLK